MTEWKLSQLTVDGKGSYGIGAPAVPLNPSLYTYLRITDIADDGTLQREGRASVDDPDAINYLLKENDIVFARTGNSTGRAYFYEPSEGDLVYAGFLIKFSLDPEKVNPRILKYYTHSKPYYDWVHSSDTGATRGNINAKTLGDMPVVLPDRSTQDRIVDILSSFDARIENNNRIIRNLEEQAQALFKSWFVDFEPWGGVMPKGWKEGCIFDVAEVLDKKRKPLSGNERDKMIKVYPYYGATSCMDYVDNYLFDGIYTLLGEDGSVVREDGTPYVQYVWGKLWVNNHAHVLQGKNGYSTEMLHAMLSQLNIVSLVTGAVQAKLNQGNMQKIKVVIASDDVMQMASNTIGALYAQIRNNQEQSTRLANLRDSLLPKLMKGEIEL